MSYIGSTFSQQVTTPAVDYFNGNGVTTTFQLTRAVTSVNAIQVVVNNVPQNAREAYGINASNQIVFTSAPSAGTNNIYVIYDSQVGQFVTPSPGTVTASSLATGSVNQSALDVSLAGGTGAMLLPSGTTAQRPSSPILGMQRWNTTLGVMEVFIAPNTWEVIASSSYTVEYLVIAGGASGGNLGGGGAGGYLADQTTVNATVNYAVIVGGGGSAVPAGSNQGINGTNSSAFGLTAIGGGGGARAANGQAGSAGGSGGGGGADGTAGPGGAGTAGQGTQGGAASANGAGTRFEGGGGGGAGQAGGNSAANVGGPGGNGTSSSINGTATTRGGGGGGGAYILNSTGTGGAGGTGGGGNGGRNGLNATSGSTNTGSGGGGAGYTSAGNVQGPSGAGGSGIVIIRYLGSQRGAGGTVTSSGGFTIHTFTTSGTFTA